MKKAILIVILGLASLLMKSTASLRQSLLSGALDSVQHEIFPCEAGGGFWRMPLYFIENKGQMDERVAYYVQGKDNSIYFTSEGLTHVLTKTESSKQDQTVDTRRGLPQKQIFQIYWTKAPLKSLRPSGAGL